MNRSKHIIRLYAVLTIGSALIAAFLAMCWVLGLYYDLAERPAWIGNEPANVARAAAADGNGYSFMVVSDSRVGELTFFQILQAAREVKPDFIIHTGDFSRNQERLYHKLFWRDMAWADLPMPMLLAPGNHDVHKLREVNVEVFRDYYGQSEFSFYVGRDLFIVLNNAPWYDEDAYWLEFFETTLEHRRPDTRRIFVFMHKFVDGVNPFLPTNYGSKGSGRFKQLCREHNVTYSFAGDHHCHFRRTIDGTTYFITGGGGSPLYGTVGAFHHAMLLRVKPDEVIEAILPIQHPRGAGLYPLRRVPVAKVYWWFRSGLLGMIVGIGALLFEVGMTALFARKWRRASRAARSG
jgi:hypothetical protein